MSAVQTHVYWLHPVFADFERWILQGVFKEPPAMTGKEKPPCWMLDPYPMVYPTDVVENPSKNHIPSIHI
jgi:hypothetical protein